MNSLPFHSITAVILADGKCARFGTEKSLILVENQPLFSRNIQLLSNIFSQVMMVTSKPALIKSYPQIQAAEDIFKQCGPLGGIHAALTNIKTDYAFVFACDMPYLNQELIELQAFSFLSANCDVFVPKHEQGIEPLHAIYSKNCLSFIAGQLERKVCPIREFYSEVDTKYFEVPLHLTQSFFNINTLHDYHLIKQMKES
jgi:molybdopterin-guanine dinucleotide biosynthesis protein A